jgi:Domain of unknown function (DUF4976)
VKDSVNGKPYDAYTIRTKRYRYIYYPPSGLEELYDHDTDRNEWNNIAYKPANRKLIEDLRAEMLKQIPNLTWSRDMPKGYRLLDDGTIEKLNYVPLENLKQLRWGL